jgi:hypothetical protein
VAEWLRNGLQNRIGASIIGGHEFQAKLIKLAEAPLKSFENSLSERSGTDVRILAKSDHPKTGAFSYFESFSQIYRSVFCLAGAGGIAVFLVAVKRLYC